MRDANHVIPIADAKSMANERMSSHTATPKGMRTIITIGDVKGIIEHHHAMPPSGSSALNKPT